MTDSRLGPLSPRQQTIWRVLEPYIETFIDLDLNDPDEYQSFNDLVVEIDEAL